MLFFTGLSGSGKSTLARALMDRVLEQGERTVTSLDGDVVRRHLSAGLGFSREDRETNITRIGWVAAEIARHGGVAICSPIAPFASTRATVREMVEEAGGEFFLVHVATPLEECERRDRKGLYAKARRGEIPDFTGISSPYEEPEDAAVRVDTTGRTIEDALDDVLEALADTGHLDLRPAPTPSAVEEDDPGARLAPPPRPLRLHRQHLPLRLARAGRPQPGRAGHRVHQRRHPRLHRPPDGRGDVRHARRRPTTAFRSRRLTRETLDQADLVLTAESSHRAFILEEHPQALRKVFTLGQFARAAQASPDLRGRSLLTAAGERRTAPLPRTTSTTPTGAGMRPHRPQRARCRQC